MHLKNNEDTIEVEVTEETKVEEPTTTEEAPAEATE